jgi:metal-dependent amidase/aminoacylase/carboxypeptidase family protein
MLKFSKATVSVAILFSAIATSMVADAGFAYELDAENSALSSTTITVDPVVIAADAAKADQATTAASGTIAPVIFTPGIGEGNVIKLPAPDSVTIEKPNSSAAPEIERKTAKSLAALVAMQDTKAPLDAQAHCLAGAVYFESKGESLAGQLAVAKVVMARAKSGRFASTLCGVVFQKSQFSFVRGGRMPAIDKSGANWRNAVAIAQIALSNSWKSPVEGALYFHARYVSPGWRLSRIGTIDNHIFYR